MNTVAIGHGWVVGWVAGWVGGWVGGRMGGEASGWVIAVFFVSSFIHNVYIYI